MLADSLKTSKIGGQNEFNEMDIVYTANYVVFVAELDANTRPLFNPDTYTMRDFDTEAEMLAYIEDNDLEIVDVEDEIN